MFRMLLCVVPRVEFELPSGLLSTDKSSFCRDRQLLETGRLTILCQGKSEMAVAVRLAAVQLMSAEKVCA